MRTRTLPYRTDRPPWALDLRGLDLRPRIRPGSAGVYVASATQLGEYGETLFATPGHVYGPDGLRVSRDTGARSTCKLDPTAPGRWRALYGDTFLDDFEALDEEPLPFSVSRLRRIPVLPEPPAAATGAVPSSLARCRGPRRRKRPPPHRPPAP